MNRILGFVLLLLGASSANAIAQETVTAEEIVAGLVARDHQIAGFSVTFETVSDFHDGRTGRLPKQYERVVQGDRAYLSLRSRNIDTGLSSRRVMSFNGHHYTRIEPSTQTVAISRMSPWGSMTTLDHFVSIGLGSDQMRLGEWYSQHSAHVVDVQKVGEYTAYCISDNGQTDPIGLNSEGYRTWVIPELDFSPVRTDHFRSGSLHHVWEYSDFAKDKNGKWAPKAITEWYLNVDEGQTEFDTQEPTGNWAKVRAEIKEMHFDKQYDDDFFDLEISEE